MKVKQNSDWTVGDLNIIVIEILPLKLKDFTVGKLFSLDLG
jgi:hypothetical protein